MLLDM